MVALDGPLGQGWVTRGKCVTRREGGEEGRELGAVEVGSGWARGAKGWRSPANRRGCTGTAPALHSGRERL